ncbi:MAG: UvrD-helicase domain-containing protein, partial [Gemmatimonadales bacterium]|nr:UvrD-helicase domain-containing protein [Gemmatimonadales bacterium]NIP08882.1 UvrD-helicase domain-containing protein [Gemmatimonadales bacterium]
PAGPALVLAGPGSGKTRVLTHRLAYRIQHDGVPAEGVVALTFTNKAAKEMGARVRQLLDEGDPRTSRVSLGTFHAFAARILRREADRLNVSRDFVIFDQSDQLEVVRAVLKELNLDPQKIQPGSVHAAISNAKNELIEASEYEPSSYHAEVTRRVYQRYEQLLAQNNAL